MFKNLSLFQSTLILIIQPLIVSIVYAVEDTIVYASTDSYHYRIPAITTDNQASFPKLYAFAERRKKNSNMDCKDSGEVDIVMKTSTNGGLHWSSERVVAGNKSISIDIDQHQSFTNPTVLYANGKLHLIFNTHLKAQCSISRSESATNIFKNGDRKFWHSYTLDDGKSWSKAEEIVIPRTLQDRVDMVGPGNGIITEDDRLIFPASGKNLISVDDGKNWIVTATLHGGSEGTIIQLCDKRLMRNDRPGFTNTKYILGKNKANNRVYSIGNKSGNTWSAWQVMTGIAMPVNPWVQASLVKIGCSDNNLTKLAFSTPNHPKSREKMSIFLSEDSGVTWQKRRQLTDGKSDYSSLVKVSKNELGILFEEGPGTARISFVSMLIYP